MQHTCYYETAMKNLERRPWGKNLEAVDAARAQMKEEAILEASAKSQKIAEYTEAIKERVREGDIVEVENVLSEIHTPATRNEFERNRNVLVGFIKTTIREASKKHGAEAVNKLLKSRRLRGLERAFEKKWGSSLK